MHKINHSEKNITPFGGLNYIYEAFISAGIPQVIDKLMGKRDNRATYKYSDITLSLFGNAMCNGEYVSDLKNFKAKFKNQLFSSIPSHDSVEYACQSLKVSNKVFTVEKAGKTITHEVNAPDALNKALVSLGVFCGLLKPGAGETTLDYDNAIVANEKHDSRKTYKMNEGYHPGIAFVGECPVHIENHNGNTPARYRQKEIIEACLSNLEVSGVIAKHFRGDSASYQENVLGLLEGKKCHYYIRNSDSKAFALACAGEGVVWQKVEINNKVLEVASVEYHAFGHETTRRVVATRSMRADRQIDLFTGNAYEYRGIITSNREMGNKEVIEFYNQRGNDSERGNKCLLSDFNLKHLPFMDMDTNTVYMLLMAMCNVLFEYAKRILVHNKATGVSLSDRVKKVCFWYVSVCTAFTKHSRQMILTVFGPVEYHRLVSKE